jgi:hypothetical protein
MWLRLWKNRLVSVVNMLGGVKQREYAGNCALVALPCYKEEEGGEETFIDSIPSFRLCLLWLGCT